MTRKLTVLLMTGIMLLASVVAASALTDQERLGQILYFDRFLSANQNQACATCHDPAVAGFADPLNQRLPGEFVVSVGSFTNLVGGRNAPPASYAKFSPKFHLDEVDGLYKGGQFWDGRATGDVTGDPLGDQAMGPFLNSVEMAMGTEENVLAALVNEANPNAEEYITLFDIVYAVDITDPSDPHQAYIDLALAIAAFERTASFASFTSKYDAVQEGVESFTAEEQAGFDIFNNDIPLADGSGAGKCFLCHPEPFFTDFSYDNLGIPMSKNKLIKQNPVDLGLGGVLVDPAEDGKFKVSSLRNLALTPPYGHNGYFTTIEEIVHFYNTRDVKIAKWPAPEVSANVNNVELGNLGLTVQDEANLVAFLKTLSDRPGMPSYPPAGF